MGYGREGLVEEDEGVRERCENRERGKRKEQNLPFQGTDRKR